jgi:hypothetical protein
MCWGELAAVGTEESSAAGGTVNAPWTAGAKVVKQHWTPESGGVPLQQEQAGQKPKKPVGIRELKVLKCGCA